jgi:integrase
MILPLRAIYRRALTRGELAINPTLKLTLPAVRGRRERTAHPDEADALITDVPLKDRALWATAFYAGLRRGELQAVTWSDIDLRRGLIHVNHAWDRKAGLIEPKSRSGKRRVPITKTLRRYLIAHRLQQGNGGTGYAFTNQLGGTFDAVTIHTRARKAWKAAGLTPLTLHDCRHTYASLSIAAAVNTKALSTYMGHSTITIMLDRYGHLLPGNEQQAAHLLDALLTSPAQLGKSPTPCPPCSESPSTVNLRLTRTARWIDVLHGKEGVNGSSPSEGFTLIRRLSQLGTVLLSASATAFTRESGATAG